jgi:hypothetical protein
MLYTAEKSRLFEVEKAVLGKRLTYLCEPKAAVEMSKLLPILF